MKMRIAGICLFALCALQGFAQSAPAAQSSEGSTPATKSQTKEELLKYMEETRRNFLNSVKGLSEAQLKFKPAPDRWSVMEVSEHIARSEDFLGDAAMKMMSTPLAEKKSPMAGNDDKLVAALNDRSKKFQAPEPLKPTGKWATETDIISAFNASRDKHEEFVKNTPESDLRAHLQAGPAGDLDAHEWMLFMAAHSARHTKQIEEVKADPNFPKS
jgi:DinB family protein